MFRSPMLTWSEAVNKVSIFHFWKSGTGEGEVVQKKLKDLGRKKERTLLEQQESLEGCGVTDDDDDEFSPEMAILWSQNNPK